MKGDREKCIEAGAWDYLSKPVDPLQLLAVLQRLAVPLKRRSPRRRSTRRSDARTKTREHPDRRRPAGEAARLRARSSTTSARTWSCARSGAEALREVLQQRVRGHPARRQHARTSTASRPPTLIRQYKQSAHTPIIFITAYADEMQTAAGLLARRGRLHPRRRSCPRCCARKVQGVRRAAPDAAAAAPTRRRARRARRSRGGARAAAEENTRRSTSSRTRAASSAPRSISRQRHAPPARAAGAACVRRGARVDAGRRKPARSMTVSARRRPDVRAGAARRARCRCVLRERRPCERRRRRAGIAATLCYPLQIGERVIGAFALGYAGREPRTATCMRGARRARRDRARERAPLPQPPARDRALARRRRRELQDVEPAQGRVPRDARRTSCAIRSRRSATRSR